MGEIFMKKVFFIVSLSVGITAIRAVDLQPTQQTTLWFTNTYSGVVNVTVTNANNNKITKSLAFSDKKSITIPGVIVGITAQTKKQEQVITATKTGTPSSQYFTIGPCSGTSDCIQFIE